MELLIIRSGKDYIRIKDEVYTTCRLDKASVFPIDMLDVVKTHFEKMKEKQFPKVSIRKLTLTEEPFE